MLTLIILCSIGVGNAWGDSYTITFSGSKSESTALSGTAASICGSSTYVTGDVSDVSRAYGPTSNGVKVGASSNAGTFTLSLSAWGKVTPDSIVVNCKLYNSTKSETVNVNSIGAQSVPSSWGNVSFTTSTALTSLTIASSKYIWVKSVTVYYTSGDGSTPTISVTPTSIDFGTVDIGNSPTETFVVKGSNLTGDITLSGASAPMSLSATTITKAEAETVSGKTITVTYTPTSTASTSQTITLASSGATNKSVSLAGQGQQKYAVHYFVNSVEQVGLKEMVISGETVSGLPDEEDITNCDVDGHPYFVGWSTSNFGTRNTAPTTLVDGTEPITEETYYYAVFAAGTGGSVSTMSINFESSTGSYPGWSWSNFTSNQSGSITAHGGSKYGTTNGKTTGYVKTTSKIASPTSLTVYVSKQTNNTTSSTWYIKVSSDGSTWTNVATKSATGMSAGTWQEFTADLSSYSDVYVELYYSGSTAVRNMDDLVLTSGTPPNYTEWITTCADCNENPTVGVAALKGTFSASGVGVTCPTTGTNAGSSCSWQDYGFIWSTSKNAVGTLVLNSDGTAPSGVTKVSVGSSGNTNTFDGTIAPSPFNARTYYYRAYGKNNYASGSYQYSSSVSSFVARSVTFDLNGHGSSTPSTQYVNNGSKATDPSYSESVTGWRFDGWYANSSCTGSAWDFSTNTVSGDNVTLYAKWTQVYTVTYNYNGGTSSCADANKYAAGTIVPVCSTPPTKAGSTFQGWLGDNNIGTKAAGSTFTMPAADVALTAQWTDTEYTLTQTIGSHTTKGHTGKVITSGMTSSSGLDLTYTISDNGYALPKTVTISGGGQTWTLGTNYTWALSADKHSATLHIGNDLTISDHVIVTIEEQTRYTVVWDEHGNTTTDYYAADDNMVVEKTGIADCGTKKFALWTENSSFNAHATTPPAKATFGAISGDKRYYAIYGTATGEGGYSKVTTVAEGEVYLLACPSKSKVYVGQHQTDVYGDDADVTISDDKISSKGTAHEVRIEGNASKFAIYDIDAKKYIFGPSSDGTSCSWSDGPTDSETTYHWWNIGSGDYAGEIQGKNQTARYFSYNYSGSSHRFAAYKTPGSNSTGKVYFYKYAPGFMDYAKTCVQYDIHIAATSDGTVTTTPADEAGSGATVTVNVTPNSCKYLSALKYNDGSDHAISIASTPYTFTMPASDVTVTATFADKSVSSIAVNTSTHRTLMQNTSFVGEQIRVTYNNGETEYLAWDDRSLTFSGYTMSRLGSQMVNVAYSGSCGNANTSYEIEITDGIPVTYNDGNVTFVRKYQVGDIVGVDTITGKIGCSGYTFVGWSETEISSPADEYVPVHNFTATTKTLYAVYSLQKKTGWMSIESADEIKSGAEYMYVKVRYDDKFALANTASAANSNYMAASLVTDDMGTWRRTSDNKDFQTFTGEAPVASIWQVIKQSTNYYLYNADAAKYLKITDSAIQLTTTPDDNFSFVDGYNDCEVMIQSSNSNYYASGYKSNSNYYFNPYSSDATGHYLLTRDSLFTTNPPCGPRSVTFHGNGGTVTASGSGSSGGNLVVTEATRDAGINLPTASIDAEDCEGNAWNFFGWIDHPVDVTRVPILTTDMLNDGYDPLNPNPHYDIVTDNDEFWAVYANTGAPETKYGTISFTMSDFSLSYSSTENTTRKTVTNMGEYVFGYVNLGHSSQTGIQFQENTGELYNKTSLGKVNSISFTTFNSGDINKLKVYVGNEEKTTDHQLTAAEMQNVGSTWTYYPTENESYFYITNVGIGNGSYVCVSGISVDFGQGTTVYATTPVCSTISLSGDVYVTSRNGVGIMAVTPLNVEAHQLAANADVVITSNSSDVYFSTDRTPNFIKASKPTASVTVRANASGELDATPIYVHYKPSSTGTGAASDVTVYANLSPANPNIKGEHTIHVRNLPEKFVIAAKVGGAYYALPADMNTATNPSGVVIEVDEMNMTAVAPNTCSYTIWPVKTTYTSNDRYALQDGNAYGERVRFAAVNNNDKALWANDAASGTTIKNWAYIKELSDGSTGDIGEGTNSAYEWKITTTVVDGNWQYTLQTDQTINQKYLRYWSAASGGPKWGTYASGEQNLYFLPVTEVEPFEMQVVEWYPTKVLVNTTSDLTGNTLTVRVNGSVDGDAAVTAKGSNLYEISNLDLAGNPTKLLRVDCGTSPITSCTKAIPVIISRSTQNVTAAPFTTLTKEVYSKADLVVRDGAVLTLNGTIEENTFSSVTIYPTAKISVPSDKKLTANSLTFFGGIDDIYNGSTYTVNKYGVPELSLKGKVGKALSTINYDMRVDLSQMYALALPYDVDIAAITYWDGTAMTPGTDLYISAYDGQARVNRESRTWIYETDFEEKLGAAKLKAGVGYTISAELQSGFGNAYSIIRMPMQAGLTADATEVAKTVAVVAYVNNQGATVTDNHKGWNFVGNPYMTSISGSSAGGASDAKLVVGCLVPNTNVTPWDGSYMWKNDTYRYVTIPSDDGSENWQSKWTDVTLKPFKNFFIQVATSGDLSFALASRANAPARYMQAQDHEVEFEVLLSSAMSHDHTGLLLADKYTPAYEINADLEKMENPMSVYTLSSGYKLAYNALSPNDAKQPIPVGYIADKAGIYTFELDENSNVDEVEHVWLTDYELNRVTDLMDATYEFTTVAGRNETRFALAIELKAEETIPTNINELVMDRNADGAMKFIYNDKMYILNKGVIYDATGKRVNVINK